MVVIFYFFVSRHHAAFLHDHKNGGDLDEPLPHVDELLLSFECLREKKTECGGVMGTLSSITSSHSL